MQKQYILTITADTVEKDYPNYRFNYGTKQEFIDSVIMDIERTPLDENGVPSFGYSITLKELN